MSLFKGKGRVEPTVFEEHNIEELFSSESDFDAVLTVEARVQLKEARAQKRAAKNAKIKALAERNGQLEAENAKQKAAIQARSYSLVNFLKYTHKMALWIIKRPLFNTKYPRFYHPFFAAT